MKYLLLTLSFFTQFVFANDDKAISYSKFYQDNPHKFFNDIDEKKFTGGYLVDGDNSLSSSWSGKISNHDLYIDIHNDKINVITNNKRFILNLQNAILFSGEQHSDLDDHVSPTLHIKTNRIKHSVVNCIEAIPIGAYQNQPYLNKMDVYVFILNHAKPQLYKLPNIMASCSGVTITPKGELVIPHWTVDNFTFADRDHLESAPPSFTIQYYQLIHQNFVPFGSPIKGEYISNNDHTPNYNFVISH